MIFASCTTDLELALTLEHETAKKRPEEVVSAFAKLKAREIKTYICYHIILLYHVN
jgi:hypothetical protein